MTAFIPSKIFPHLSRSALHRCLQRHGISRLPHLGKDNPRTEKKTLQPYQLGFFHLDISQVYTQVGKLYLFVAIDRTTQYSVAQLYDNQTAATAVKFLKALSASLPYPMHTVWTDNGPQFTAYRRDKFQHVFTQACKEEAIKHKLTQVGHPGTNGQVERMHRTLKEVLLSYA